MSIAAMTWAFAQTLRPSSLKFLLVALADNADDEGRAFPSVEMLAAKTSQDRKTVISGLDQLERLCLATDTGSRVGKTKQVKVYRLERFMEVSKGSENGTLSPESLPKTEQFRKRNSTENTLKGSQKRTSSPSVSPLKLPSPPPAPLEPSGNRQIERDTRGRARARRVPVDFVITPELRLWANEKCPGVDIETETEKFRDHEYRDPRSDWPAAWRTWMRNAPEFSPRVRANGSIRRVYRDAPTTEELEALEKSRAGQ